MLGDTIAMVKQTLKTLIPDATKFGTDGPAQELALTSLAAVWKTCSTMQDHFAARRAKMEEDPSKVPEIPGEDHAEFRETFVARHPDVVLPIHREPHRKFVERVQRDHLVHGFVHFSTKSARSALETSRSLRSQVSLGMPRTCSEWSQWINQ